MGHLALRYQDASRSGVYRVSDAAVPREAAVEAGSILAQVEVANGAGAPSHLEAVLADPGRDPRVVIVRGADVLATERAADFRALVAALESAAGARRERGVPFFVVLVDPGQVLALPALYREPGSAR